MIKPSHLIGGYAQLAYDFNYYGAIGTNRDEFVIIRKVKTVDWLEDSYPDDRDKPPMTAPGAPPQSGAAPLGGALTSAATPAE